MPFLHDFPRKLSSVAKYDSDCTSNEDEDGLRYLLHESQHGKRGRNQNGGQINQRTFAQNHSSSSNRTDGSRSYTLNESFTAGSWRIAGGTAQQK
jgi:hypothetical protein